MKFHGKAKAPVLLIHGGAGPVVKYSLMDKVNEALREIIDAVHGDLERGATAVEAVTQANYLLEDCGLFNAGKGAVLQADKKARVTASLMDGVKRKFSAVHNIQGTHYPSRIALALQEEDDHIVDATGGEALAKKLGISLDAEPSEEQLEQLEKAQKPPKKHGTIGAVALDQRGKFAAATSTGGVINSVAGRMSDVGTVAGNFASPYAAISCTGVGDHIVNNAGAARLEARVRDGGTIIDASKQQLKEAKILEADYGWIAVGDKAHWAAFYNSEAMSFAVKCSGEEAKVVVNNR